VQLALQDAQLLLERGILGLKPKLRPEWQDQQSQKEDEQPDHYRVTVSDFRAISRRMRFSAHTGGLQAAANWRRLNIVTSLWL
jgi:hypothetical protein